MDVNEKIVETWLREQEGMFTITSILFGTFHSDIDLLAANLNRKEIWDCEVKVRTGSTQISNNDNKQNGFQHFVDALKDSGREKKIREVIGKTDFKITKKFITTKSLLGSTKATQDKWIKRFGDENIEVIFFDKIIKDLSSKAQVIHKSNNEVIQVLRLFHIYEDKKAA